MLWKNRRSSGNIVDRRSMGAPMGIGTLIVGALVYYFMGGNPADFIAQNAQVAQYEEASPAEDETRDFIGVVLADTEDVWNDIFQKNNSRYQEPKLVLFRGAVESACGRATSAVGPFYCPADQQVYLDLGFFKTLETSYQASGDFASAYVVAHEVGHHVQNLLGIDKAHRRASAGLGRTEQNRLSVKLELQADCFAGVWAKRTEKEKQVLEQGDIEEAIGAASAVGDDNIQRASRGEVVPDSFTHGSAAQRVAAFKAGFRSGDMKACL